MQTPETPNSRFPCRPPAVKVFHDCIWGPLEMDPLMVAIIDCHYFQRLRMLKAVGGCSYVYPTATHSRFEHSLGVAHLAGLVLEGLQSRQPELNISEIDVLCVRIAGLCHDLGHGPLSHMFESQFLAKISAKKWNHELGSVLMLEHMLNHVDGLRDECILRGFTSRDFTFIKELIAGAHPTIYEHQSRGPKSPQMDPPQASDWPYRGRGPEKGFLYEIVANETTSIDVDKFDYLCRDAHMVGFPVPQAHFLRVLQGFTAFPVENRIRICFSEKLKHDIFKLFELRLDMHRRVYKHRVVKIVEDMMCDALLEANPYLKISSGPSAMSQSKPFLLMSETIDDMEAFSNLDDSIFSIIKNSHKPELEKAKSILRRIDQRKLYTFLGEIYLGNVKMNEKDIALELSNLIKTSTFSTFLQTQDSKLSAANLDNISVHVVYFDYGRGNSHPLSGVPFYSKGSVQCESDADPKIPRMDPLHFQEYVCRIFLRSQTGYEIAADAFQKLKTSLEEPKHQPIQTPPLPFAPQKRPSTQTRTAASHACVEKPSTNSCIHPACGEDRTKRRLHF